MERRAPLGLIAALPEECRFVLRWKGWKPVSGTATVPVYEHPELGLRMVVSGMGGRRARSGLDVLLTGFLPEAVLSFGFGGALDSSLGVGDIVWGREVLLCSEAKGVCGSLELAHPSDPAFSGLAAGTRAVLGSLVSVDGFVDKARVRDRLNSKSLPAVLEMETYALAEALQDKGIRLMGLRAVSDEWDFDPSPFVRNWLNDDLEIRISLVMRDLLRHPGRVLLLLGMLRRSRAAAASLAEGIGSLLNS